VVLVRGSSRTRRLAVLGSLYLAQGIVYGFGGFILVPTLAAAGVSLGAQAGILALAGLPWVLKLFWAPVLDRFGGLDSGRARSFAAVSMLAMGAVLAALGAQPDLPAAPVTVGWLWLLLNVALSLQDVSTDALVLDLVPPQERGVTNGVLLGGHHLGAEGVGSLGLGLIVASQGLGAALWGQALIMIALAGLPWLLPRPEHQGGRAPGSSGSSGAALWAALAELLRTRSAAGVAVVAALILSADVLTSTVSGQFWTRRLHWSVEELSTKLAPILLVSNLVAYALSTVVVDRLGHGRSAALGSVALGSLWIGFGLVPGFWSESTFLVAFVVAQALATAGLYVGLHAALMDATRPELRASHFAVLMALLNLPRVLVAPAAPAILEALDYTGLFIAAGTFQIAMAGVLRLSGLGMRLTSDFDAAAPERSHR